MMIYVVIGSTGEYSDHYEWPVCAFDTLEAAQAFVVHATAFGNKLKNREEREKRRRENGWAIWNATPAERAAWPDPNFSADYSGFNYAYYPVPLNERPVVTETTIAEIERHRKIKVTE